jgi:DNA invertase Pin-like site-specific DNA recombinase
VKIGYARVSTQDQELAGQLDALSAAGCERVYQEKISGKNADRPELKAMLASVQAGDVVIVTRLDRLARSTLDLLTILKELEARGAAFTSLAETWADTASPMGKLLVTLLGSIAEFERHLIRERTGAGRKRAMAAGVKFGPKEKLSDDQKAVAVARMEAGDKRADVARALGVSRRTVQRLASRAA